MDFADKLDMMEDDCDIQGFSNYEKSEIELHKQSLEELQQTVCDLIIENAIMKKKLSERDDFKARFSEAQDEARHLLAHLEALEAANADQADKLKRAQERIRALEQNAASKSVLRRIDATVPQTRLEQMQKHGGDE